MAVRSDDWLKTSADTPLRELVDGLDTIGAAPIPYARMPARARTAFAAEFSTWADITGETVHSLMTRRQAGDGTIVALVAAAEDTVRRYQVPVVVERVGAAEATGRLLDELDEADRVMLGGRIWGLQPRTKQDIGEQLGVPGVWVSRHLTRAQAKFAELLADPVHREVAEHAGELSERLGPYESAETVTTELQRLGVGLSSEAGQVMLHLAGPYTPAGAWFEAPGGQQRAVEVVGALFGRYGAPPVAEVHQGLEQLGMTAGSVAAYVRHHLQVLCVGAKLVPWDDTVAVRAAAVLHMRGSAATVEEIRSSVGDIDISVGTLRDMLFREEQFIRTSRRRWGLRVWDVQEYSGIADAVGTRIDRAGGSIRVDELYADLVASLPDVAHTSITAYMHTLAFVINGEVIRRRRPRDRWPKVPELNSVRGAYRRGDNEIRVSFPVDRNMLRGSGMAFPAAAAAALRVKPARHRKFTGPHGVVRVVWSLSSIHGPRVGSLREPAGAVGAKLGDTLVLAFDLDARTVRADVIAGHAVAGERLHRHLGHRDVTETALSAALDCEPQDIEDVLRRRGDDALADYSAALLRRWANRSA